MPGTYIAGEPVVTIAAFAPQLHVITSKQRPRKLTIHGSDGAEYMFLLKVSPLPHRCNLQQLCQFCKYCQLWKLRRSVSSSCHVTWTLLAGTMVDQLAACLSDCLHAPCM